MPGADVDKSELRMAITASRMGYGHSTDCSISGTRTINCTWVLTLSQEDRLEMVGTVSSGTLNEVEHLTLMGDQQSMERCPNSGVIALGRGVHR